MFYPLRGQRRALLSLCAQPSSVPKGLQGFPLSASAKREVFFSACGGFQSQTNHTGRGFNGSITASCWGCRTAVLLPLTPHHALGANLSKPNVSIPETWNPMVKKIIKIPEEQRTLLEKMFSLTPQASGPSTSCKGPQNVPTWLPTSACGPGCAEAGARSYFCG